MNIVSVTHIPGQEDYLLKEGDKTVLKLRYKHDLHTARVETEKERRVLIIDNEGLLRIKLILKNEYGIMIGQLTYDNFSDNQGSVEIEETRFRFSLQRTPTPELYIYKNSKKNLIYSCLLSFKGETYDTVGAENEQRDFKTPLSSLIIAVSWYLFLKDSVNAKPGLNEAIIF